MDALYRAETYSNGQCVDRYSLSLPQKNTQQIFFLSFCPPVYVPVKRPKRIYSTGQVTVIMFSSTRATVTVMIVIVMYLAFN